MTMDVLNDATFPIIQQIFHFLYSAYAYFKNTPRFNDIDILNQIAREKFYVQKYKDCAKHTFRRYNLYDDNVIALWIIRINTSNQIHTCINENALQWRL